MFRRFVVLLALVFCALGLEAAAQKRSDFQIPAEYDRYVAALNTRDPAQRAAAMEAFVAWYPNSVARLEALEQAMAAWQLAAQPAKADAIAGRLLQVDPANVRALASRVYAARTRATQGDLAAIAPMVEAAERGLAALPKWPKPITLDDESFARSRQQLAAVFGGALGYAALQARDYDRARRYFREAVGNEPDDLQDVYQLAVSQLERMPVDAQGFWYAARSIAIARAAKREDAAAEIDRYARARYRLYRGSEEGWKEILARVASGERAPAADFVKSIPRVLPPAEAALYVVEEHDPAALAFTDWALVLGNRDASPANRIAADKVWKAITDKQQDGARRLKIPVKVITATPDIIEAAITDEAQAANRADLEIAMERPLAPLPAIGSVISIIGLLSDYRPKPFRFMMTRAELAPESMPVAGGPCAEPRPQMCTRDYRPACGIKRDGSRRTYGNACTACSDPDVTTQNAGACP